MGGYEKVQNPSPDTANVTEYLWMAFFLRGGLKFFWPLIIMQPSNVIPLNPNTEIQSNQQTGEIFQGLVGEKPTCPKSLTGVSRKHFQFLVKELSKAGLLAKIDQGALEILSRAYAGMNDAYDKMQEHGEFQTTPNGYAQISPYAVQYERYSKQYEKLCVKFGVTVAGRQRVKIENPNQGSLDL